ncbi:MAG: hypothetical protein NZ561_11155, partial [Phycisphaerae bacterium]|nr:hypothetical protein [Phycisphaerae bacterium]
SPQAFEAALAAARPGDIVQTPFLDPGGLPLVGFRKDLPEPSRSVQFLLSDKPEYFRTGDGIALQEEVSAGTVRLYLYHVPEPTGKPKTISAVIENLGSEAMTLTFTHYASPKPGGDYHRVAREALTAYFERQPAPANIASRQVPPGGRLVIDPHIDAISVTRDILVHVLHEFQIDQPGRVTVFQREPSADSRQVIDHLPKLPRVLEGWHPSGAGRGLFSIGDYLISNESEAPIDTADGPKLFLVADGKTDPWIEGRDSIDPSTPIQNKGNYGVMYHVKLRYRSSDGRGLAVLMTAHRPDNKWCKYTAAVVRVNDGINRGGIVALPGTAPRFENLPQAVVMQTYPPLSQGEIGLIEFTYSPPGACCLPTPILLVPYPL